MASCAARSPLTACAKESKESRFLSLKELAALRGFHNFRWPKSVSRAKRGKMVGNAMSVPVLEAMRAVLTAARLIRWASNCGATVIKTRAGTLALLWVGSATATIDRGKQKTEALLTRIKFDFSQSVARAFRLRLIRSFQIKVHPHCFLFRPPVPAA